jgi:hypothetical protein
MPGNLPTTLLSLFRDRLTLVAVLLYEHMRASTVSTAGGHAIRLVHSSRFGRLFLAGDTGRAFSKLTQAETHARKHPKARAIASQPAITRRRAQT